MCTLGKWVYAIHYIKYYHLRAFGTGHPCVRPFVRPFVRSRPSASPHPPVFRLLPLCVLPTAVIDFIIMCCVARLPPPPPRRPTVFQCITPRLSLPLPSCASSIIVDFHTLLSLLLYFLISSISLSPKPRHRAPPPFVRPFVRPFSRSTVRPTDRPSVLPCGREPDVLHWY